MSKFLTPLSWHQVGVDSFVLDAPLRYYSDLLRRIIEVPAGFPTDGESCPRFIPVINSLFGNVAHASAVVHDRLYFTAEVKQGLADKVIYEAMVEEGVPKWRRSGIYTGLRLLGWIAWRKHRKLRHPN